MVEKFEKKNSLVLGGLNHNRIYNNYFSKKQKLLTDHIQHPLEPNLRRWKNLE
jgi:hypothetical protein